MNCPHCNAMNAAKSTNCWSCGRIISADPPAHPIPSKKPVAAKSPRPPAPPAQTEAINTNGDYWMGFAAWWVGCICATIIDRRKGFWSAFGGMLVSQVLVAIVVLIIIGASKGHGRY